VTQDLILDVAPPSSITLRQGVNGYSHDATFIRADTTTWNSGARDQMLVGKGNGIFRVLLSYNLASVTESYAVSAAQLDVWTDAAGTGTVQTLELRSLSRNFTEGTGNGTSATNGAGTGTDWLTHDGTNAWSSDGGDFNSTVLASVPGFNAVTTVNTQQSFTSSPALVSAVTTALISGTPLNLTILSPLTEPGATSNFTRLASDDHANISRRPQLTITFAHAMLPTVDPGSAPAATVGADVLLTGTTANATTSTWSLVSGPGVVWLSNASSPTSTLKFSAPGTYTLQLTAANVHGESSRTLNITVTGTAMTPIEIWRQTHFGTTQNTGTAADTFDANGDGESNLLEFATGQNPNGNTLAAISASLNGANLEFTYTRANAALAAGITFTVEWSDTLAPGSWTSIFVTEQILTDNGTVQTVKATIPAGTPMCFARLKVTTTP
jgi:hypothetical protein